jgi:UMP-CMP kinase
MKRGETSGRSDDNIESFRKRYKTYVESTQPIIQVSDHSGLEVIQSNQI